MLQDDCSVDTTFAGWGFVDLSDGLSRPSRSRSYPRFAESGELRFWIYATGNPNDETLHVKNNNCK